MSLTTQVSALATAVGTEFKTVYGRTGALNSLSTTDKTNLVAAINEVRGVAVAASGSGGASIDDAAASGTTTYSSNKINTLVDAKPDIDDASSSGTDTYSSSKINTLLSGKPNINDVSAGTTSVYSSSKTDSQISAALNSLVASAPGTLDTLDEIAAALGDDPNYAATVTTALGNRLRVDAAQALNGTQQAQGRTNLDVPSNAQVGDTTRDFVADFNAALA